MHAESFLLHKLFPESRDEWLAVRRGFTGASEIAAVVGAHPYMTAAHLYALKSGLIPPEFENQAMKRGRYLEETALRVLADEEPDWLVVPNAIPGGALFIDDVHRLCATPDAFVTAPDRPGLGIVQIKSVEPRAFHAWIEPDGKIAAPPHVVLQTQVECALAECSWALVAALVVDHGITLYRVEITPDPDLVAALGLANKTFWDMLDRGVRPPLDYDKDLGLVARLNLRERDEVLDLAQDNQFRDAVLDHVACSHDISLLEKRKSRAEALIREKLGEANAAEAGEWYITAKLVRRNGYVVEPTAYRQLRIRNRGAP